MVRRYAAHEDIEIVALIASAVAFGNVKALRAKLDDALQRIGPSPARAADDARALTARLATWKHRVWIGDDLARMIVGARRVQRASGSLVVWSPPGRAADVSITVASSIVPRLKISPALSSCLSSSPNSFSSTLCSTSRLRKRQIVLWSGTSSVSASPTKRRNDSRSARASSVSMSDRP